MSWLIKNQVSREDNVRLGAIRFFSEPVPQLRDSWDNTWCYRKPRRYRFPPCKASNLIWRQRASEQAFFYCIVFTSGFVDMKRLRIFLFPLGGIASLSQGTSPAIAGTHLHSWVKRSNYSKVSCSRTQELRFPPGWEFAFWQLGHQTLKVVSPTFYLAIFRN